MWFIFPGCIQQHLWKTAHHCPFFVCDQWHTKYPTITLTSQLKIWTLFFLTFRLDEQQLYLIHHPFIAVFVIYLCIGRKMHLIQWVGVIFFLPFYTCRSTHPPRHTHLFRYTATGYSEFLLSEMVAVTGHLFTGITHTKVHMLPYNSVHL